MFSKGVERDTHTMNWLRRNNPFENSSEQQHQSNPQAPFIIGSDKWMGGSNNPYQNFEPMQSHSGAAAPTGYSPPDYARSASMDPRRPEAPQIFRTYSQNSRRSEGPPDLYPQLFHTNSNTYEANAMASTPVDANNERAVDNEQVEASEDVLVRISDAMVHLIDDQESPLLGSGDFSVVRIEQEGNGIVVVVKVGDNLSWPLMKDEGAVKLDPTHYFFTIRVPPLVDQMDAETAKLVWTIHKYFCLSGRVKCPHFGTGL